MGKSRHIDDVFYLAGRRVDPEREQYDLMFVCSAVEEEEIAQVKRNFLGFNINQPAEYLKGATGTIKLPAGRAFLDFDDCYYTAVCKWLGCFALSMAKRWRAAFTAAWN